MFRSRCYLQKAMCTSALTPQFSTRLVRCAAVPGLRATRMLLGFTNPDMHTTTDAEYAAQNAEFQRDGAAAAAAGIDQGDAASPPSHENVFSDADAAATAGLKALFTTPRLSTPAGNVAAAGAWDGADESGESLASAAAGSHLSNGEEELEAERERYAAVEDELPAAPPTTAAAAATAAAAGLTGVAEPPINLHGAVYSAEMAAVLRKVALERGYLSPVWSAKGAFAQMGGEVEVPEGEGVVMATSTGKSVVLFNLEQTSLAERLRVSTTAELLEYRKQLTRVTNAYGSSCKPRSLIGRTFSYKRTAALTAAPSFAAWQAQCPYWITELEMASIDAQPLAAEEDNCVYVPVVEFNRDSPPSSPSSHSSRTDAPRDVSGSAAMRYGSRNNSYNSYRNSAGSGTSAARTPGSAEAPRMVRLYNVKQLQDYDTRFAPLLSLVGKLSPCYNSRGVRYNPATTWLTLEYCLRYGFPVTDDKIVMLTAERVHGMGGALLDTPRCALTSLPPSLDTDGTAAAGAAGATGEERKSRLSWLSVEQRAALTELMRQRVVAEAEMGMVPPPLTLVMRDDEVVTLYNALQTNIAEEVFERVERERQHASQNRYKPNTWNGEARGGF